MVLVLLLRRVRVRVLVRTYSCPKEYLSNNKDACDCDAGDLVTITAMWQGVRAGKVGATTAQVTRDLAVSLSNNNKEVRHPLLVPTSTPPVLIANQPLMLSLRNLILDEISRLEVRS